MRELKDYFCTFTQKHQLLDLGFDGDSNIITAEYYYNISTPFEGILRSQALDYFRELGWDFQIGSHLTKGYWFVCAIKGCGYALPNFIKEYHEAESALIDKLIELQKEARNEK